MSDPFTAALDAQFRAPGSVAAVLVAGDAPPVPIRVIPSGPTQDLTIGRKTVGVVTAFFLVRRADLDEPRRGDTLTIIGGWFEGDYTVSGGGELDEERLTLVGAGDDRVRSSRDEFDRLLNEIEGDIASNNTAAMNDAVLMLKDDLRDQVRKAGLGSRLANTWRGDVYPKRGRSLTPGGYVHSRAPDIIRSFVEGATIVPVNGSRFLAIPTDNVPARAVAADRRGA